MKKILATLAISFLFLEGWCQPNHAVVEMKLSMRQYLAAVAKGNLLYVAQQYNVGIAEAELQASRIFPDPELSFSYSNNQDNTMKMGQGVETGISYPFSLGNKRGAAMGMARAAFEQSQSALSLYFFTLRADAALAYFSAIHNQKVLELQQESFMQLKRLAEADSIRYRTGEITEIDAQQSALEAKAQQGELFQAHNDCAASRVVLTRLLGASVTDTVVLPLGYDVLMQRNFILEDLIQKGLNSRPDLMVSDKEREMAKAKLRQLKADRAFEFSLEAGYAHNLQVRNETAPAPAFSSYKAGITIPLKFSNINRSAVRSAKLSVAQSEVTFHDMQQQVIAEITNAYYSFRTAQDQLEHYSNGIVASAGQILQARIYAYQRGESTLMEVLGAHRSYNDICMEYANAQLRFATALVELERAAGIWDI